MGVSVRDSFASQITAAWLLGYAIVGVRVTPVGGAK